MPQLELNIKISFPMIPSKKKHREYTKRSLKHQDVIDLREETLENPAEFRG